MSRPLAGQGWGDPNRGGDSRTLKVAQRGRTEVAASAPHPIPLARLFMFAGYVVSGQVPPIGAVCPVNPLVAVGTTIADRPPHRSVRARLRIRLLPRMPGGKARVRIRVQNSRERNPAF
jgi:hypothetical protein